MGEARDPTISPTALKSDSSIVLQSFRQLEYVRGISTFLLYSYSFSLRQETLKYMYILQKEFKQHKPLQVALIPCFLNIINSINPPPLFFLAIIQRTFLKATNAMVLLQIFHYYIFLETGHQKLDFIFPTMLFDLAKSF